MSVNTAPRYRTFKAAGAITQYSFVKWGADNESMLACGANDKPMGIYQGEDTLASGDLGEVALPGGGAMLKVAETVALGKFLTPTAAALGEVVDAAGEVCGAVAYESGVANDIIGVEVVIFVAVATDA